MACRNRNARFLIIIIAAMILAGCAQAGARVPGPPEPPHKPVDVDPRLVRAGLDFGFDLLRALRGGDSAHNLMVSAPSVQSALGMVLNGAAGTTRADMAKVLRLDAMTLDEANRASSSLVESLRPRGSKLDLSIANSIWVARGVKLGSDFVHNNHLFYRAHLDELTSVEKVNQWVKRETRGKIERLVDALDPSTTLVIANAIYFKGQWAEPFNPSRTTEREFHLASGEKVKHLMMSRSGRFGHLNADGFQAIRLPYHGDTMSMYLFLPDETRFDDFVASLSVGKWENWMNGFSPVHGQVTLPRFKFDYDQSLKQALTQMGMAVCFDPKHADFRGIAPEVPLWIDDVIHKTFIEVNEEGTEATAVTGVIMPTSAPVQQFELVLDRPFVFAIRDEHTGVLLFLGTLMDPR